MKHLLHVTLSTFLITLATVSFGQINILSSDLTSIGDQIRRFSDTIPSYGPGGEGANQVWDFSAAVVEDTADTDVVSIASTPHSSTFSSSDYAMTGGAGSYLYFTHNNSVMSTTGAAGDLLGTGEIIEAPFSDPLVLHIFPRSYQDNHDDIYSFEAEADGSAYGVYRVKLNHYGHVYDTTDGYGSLITPYGTYDALRVKTVDFTTDEIEVKLASFLPWTPFSTTVDTSVSYSWHAKEEMLAIAEFSYDSLGNPGRFTFSTVPPVNTVGVDNVASDKKLKLYPQPAKERLCLAGLDNPTSYFAEVYNTSGALVYSENLRNNCIITDEFKAGLYVLILSDLKGTQHEVQKFLIE